ncbi:hypothetical protein GGQ68_001484 [Sagittula marina]|uniref:Uncharacterized protein n=1 Tax=Sagittula marina TaxID=943940 RepID=A0A7W6DR08_9RHOB|nr:hypothetical protein [Sagittula marina]MBB3985155.1 hypothetical protein [Sagittula marina]
MKDRPKPQQSRRAGLILRALREYRRRVGRGVTSGPAPRLGVRGSMRVIRGAWALTFVSSLNFESFCASNKSLVMLDTVSPQSKAAGIVSTLEQAGLPREAIAQPGRLSAFRRLGIKCRAVALAFRAEPWRRRLQVNDLVLVVASLLHAERFSGLSTMTVHIGDRSPRRIALATGAALAGRPTLYWQNGFHDTAIPDLGYQEAAIFNAEAEAALAGRATRLWAIESGRTADLRVPARIERLGVATNAFVGTEIDTMRSRIDQLFPNARVALRLHPRVSSFDAGRVPDWDVRPRAESLGDFAMGCDVVICGNTAAQIEILKAGTPVIHSAGLDPHGFDLYGYAARGISFGLEHWSEGDVLKDLTRFYRADGWNQRLLTEIGGPSENVPPLRDLVGRLLERPASGRLT